MFVKFPKGNFKKKKWFSYFSVNFDFLKKLHYLKTMYIMFYPYNFKLQKYLSIIRFLKFIRTTVHIIPI